MEDSPQSSPEKTFDDNSNPDIIVEIPSTTRQKFTLQFKRQSKTLFNLDIHLKKPKQRSFGVNVSGHDFSFQNPPRAMSSNAGQVSQCQQTEKQEYLDKSQQAKAEVKSRHQQTEKSKAQLFNGGSKLRNENDVEIDRNIHSYSEKISNSHFESWSNISEKIKINKQPTPDSNIKSESLTKSKLRYIKHIKDNDERISIVCSTQGNPVINEIIAFPAAAAGSNISSAPNLAVLLSNFEDSVIFRSEKGTYIAQLDSGPSKSMSSPNTRPVGSTIGLASEKSRLGDENSVVVAQVHEDPDLNSESNKSMSTNFMLDKTASGFSVTPFEKSKSDAKEELQSETSRNRNSSKLDLKNASTSTLISAMNPDSIYKKPGSNASSIMNDDDTDTSSDTIILGSTMSTLKKTLSESTLMDSTFSNLLAKKTPTLALSNHASQVQEDESAAMAARETIDVEFSDLLRIGR